jgi:hypothetical protein
MSEPKKRPGSKARPPLNTSAKSPLAGLAVNRVDLYGLQEVVRRCREEYHWGSMKIKKYIEDNNLLPEGKDIANMSIYRWYKKNVDQQEDDTTTDFAVDTAAQERSMLRAINDSIDTITECLDNISDTNNVKDIKDLVLAQEKLIARKQCLNATIGTTQEKIYTYDRFAEIVNTMLDVSKSFGIDLYAAIKARIEADPMLAEGFRRIESSKQK